MLQLFFFYSLKLLVYTYSVHFANLDNPVSPFGADQPPFSDEVM